MRVGLEGDGLMVGHLIHVYGVSINLRLKQYAQYRVDAWLQLAMRLVRFGLQLAFLGIAFSFVDRLGDWTPWEVVLMWCTGVIGFYIHDSFFSFATQSKLSFYQGSLDYALVRPLPVYMQESAREMPFESLLNLVFFGVAFTVAVVRLELFMQPVTMLLLMVALAASALVWTGIATFISCITVWVGRTFSLWQSFSSLNDYVKYPLDIFPVPLQSLLTIIPFGFTTFYPVAFALRGREYAWPGAFSLGVGLLVFGIAYVTYVFALRHYSSTGTVE